MITDPADLEYLPWPPAPAGGMFTGRFPTGCRLVHRPTGVSVIKTEDRHEHRNKAAALDELALILSHRDGAVGWDERERSPTDPGAAAVGLPASAQPTADPAGAADV